MTLNYQWTLSAPKEGSFTISPATLEHKGRRLQTKPITITATKQAGITDLPEDLMDLNPYHTVPTLVDRDLTLYDSRVIIEYLDERFPHPPLLPVDPVSRARSRQLMYRVDLDWYLLAGRIGGKTGAEADAARKQLAESLTASAPIFAASTMYLRSVSRCGP